MEKIDRLGWAAGLSIVSYGVRIGIRVNVPEALALLTPHLPAEWEPSASPVVDRLFSVILGADSRQRGVRRFHIAYVDALRLARTLELEQLIEVVAFDLERHVAQSAPRKLVVHAGVVGWHGRAILVPGRSGSGKSTLVAALVREGATYYSDEFAFLDARGRVHPFRRPLRLRGEAGRKTVLPDAVDPQAALPPLAVGSVLFANYRAGADWRPQSLSPGRATLELLAHSVNGRLAPRQAIAALKRATSSAEALKGPRGEADALVRWLRRPGREATAAALRSAS